MKKKIIFFISLFLLGCSAVEQQSNIESCPQVLFLKDYRNYVTTEESLLTYENISYRAEINNYNFDKECQVSNNTLNGKLSILFVINPDKAKKSNIIIPYFIAIVDNQQNIKDLQYYSVSGNLDKNLDTSLYNETEIIDIQNISIPYRDEFTGKKNKILIGFMLDKEKLKILN